jgi:hypothetical protein
MFKLAKHSQCGAGDDGVAEGARTPDLQYHKLAL